jgi:hypothetical protein
VLYMWISAPNIKLHASHAMLCAARIKSLRSSNVKYKLYISYNDIYLDASARRLLCNADARAIFLFASYELFLGRAAVIHLSIPHGRSFFYRMSYNDI